MSDALQPNFSPPTGPADREAAASSRDWEGPTAEELDRLDALAKAATPGPWFRGDWRTENISERDNDLWKLTRRPAESGSMLISADRPQSPFQFNGYPYPKLRVVGGCGCCDSPFGKDEDADFIAAANPATVLRLVADVRRLRAERDEWRTRAKACVPPEVAEAARELEDAAGLHPWFSAEMRSVSQWVLRTAAGPTH